METTETVKTVQTFLSLPTIMDSLSDMKATEKQVSSVLAIHEKWNEKIISIYPELCGPALMVQVPGMWLGVEKDGYTHS